VQLSGSTIKLTAAERAVLAKKERRAQAEFERMAAAATPEERERIAARLWFEQVERPRAARRIKAARRQTPARPVLMMRARTSAAPREHRAASSSRSSGQDPGSDDPDPEPPPRPLAGPSPRFSRPWRDVDEAVAERRRALAALAAQDPQQLTLERVA
jgi:hypothetical protein